MKAFADLFLVATSAVMCGVSVGQGKYMLSLIYFMAIIFFWNHLQRQD